MSCATARGPAYWHSPRAAASDLCQHALRAAQRRALRQRKPGPPCAAADGRWARAQVLASAPFSALYYTFYSSLQRRFQQARRPGPGARRGAGESRRTLGPGVASLESHATDLAMAWLRRCMLARGRVLGELC